MNNPDQPSAKTKEPISQNVQLVALELAKVFRAFELYPGGHPQLKSIIKFSFDKISPELNKMGEVIFTVSRDGLYYQGKLLEGQRQALNQLTSELHIRQVRKFAFRKSLELKEFMDFLELLLIPAEEFRSGKKIEGYFREKRIRSIWINEVDFGRVSVGQPGLEEATEEDEVKEKEKGFERLDFLIQGLDSAEDDQQAQAALENIEPEIEQWADKEKFPEQWYLLGALSDFFEQKGKALPLSGKKAEALLKRFSGPKFLSRLVNNFIYSDEDSGRAFIRYFDQVGEPALKAMLERLMAPESIYFQKELVNYLKRKGKVVRPIIESTLAGQKASPNSKLVYLLGEFRSPESAPLLLELMSQPDPGLRRETIHALGKIKSKKASLELTSRLRDKKLDSETKLVLIQTLAEMQETIAVTGLIALLKNRSEESEVREKAAEALGRIGSREALGALTGILKKPWPLRKPEPEKIKIKSAEALAKIGGERAEAFLSEIARGEGILARHCQELVKPMQAKKRK